MTISTEQEAYFVVNDWGAWTFIENERCRGLSLETSAFFTNRSAMIDVTIVCNQKKSLSHVWFFKMQEAARACCSS